MLPGWPLGRLGAPSSPSDGRLRARESVMSGGGEEKKPEAMGEEAVSTQIDSLRGRIKLLLGLLLLALLAAIGGGAYSFIQIGKLQHQITALEEAAKKAEHGADPAVEGIDKPTREPGQVHPLGNFVVNLMDPGQVRYVNCRIEVEVEDPEIIKDITGREAQFKDAVISLLGAQTYEDLVGVEGKTKLREELMVRFNKLLSKGQIARVYLTEFVIQ